MKAITVPAEGRRVNSFLIESLPFMPFECSASPNRLKLRSCGGCEDACNGTAQAEAQDTRSAGQAGDPPRGRQEDGFEPATGGDREVPAWADPGGRPSPPGSPRADGEA